MSEKTLAVSEKSSSFGVICKICGSFIELNDMERECIKFGHPIDIFPICDDCCSFIRRLKERNGNV